MTANEMRGHLRYPYTYACDYIREAFGPHKYSRGDASRWMKMQAEAIGLDNHRKVAVDIAELYIEKYAIEMKAPTMLEKLEAIGYPTSIPPTTYEET